MATVEPVAREWFVRPAPGVVRVHLDHLRDPSGTSTSRPWSASFADDVALAREGQCGVTLVKYPDLRVVLIALRKGGRRVEAKTEARFPPDASRPPGASPARGTNRHPRRSPGDAEGRDGVQHRGPDRQRAAPDAVVAARGRAAAKGRPGVVELARPELDVARPAARPLDLSAASSGRSAEDAPAGGSPDALRLERPPVTPVAQPSERVTSKVRLSSTAADTVWPAAETVRETSEAMSPTAVVAVVTMFPVECWVPDIESALVPLMVSATP